MEANNKESREDLVYIIDIALQAELIEDVWQGFKRLAKMDGEFTREERSLLDLMMMTYSRRFRVAYREISTTEMRLEGKGKDRKWELCTIYLQKLKDEYEQLLLDVINVIDTDILPKIRVMAELVQWYKYKGQYWQQIQDLKRGNDQDNAKNQARICYETGVEYAKELDDIEIAKLGIILAYSVFIYERLNDPLRAVAIASEHWHATSPKLDDLHDEEQWKQVSIMLTLFRDYLTQWITDGLDPKTGKNRVLDDGDE